MVFQSSGFLIFFAVFFFVFWSVSGRSAIRNGLLLAAGIFLYSLWDYRFTVLLAFIILLNYLAGKYVSNKSFKGKLIFYVTLVLNLAPLMYFKYYNFFAESINNFLLITGLNFNISTLKLLLPVGISFYTFLSVSYLIDVFKNQIKPETNLIDYALSISYFPIIMSGPIHRPKMFLKQLKEINKFDYNLAAEGLRQILTGLFYKVVIADSIAKHADKAFAGYGDYNGLTLLIGSVYFSFQLYFDFNGYSEMAIGISKLLSFRIERNFRFPYLSRTIADFWKRWHISLTEWFRDYIFLPLSFIVSRKVKQGSVFDNDLFVYSAGIFVTWALTGFWHGAGSAFILWGMFHAVLLINNKWFFKKKKKLLKLLGIHRNNLLLVISESLTTFLLVNVSFIFFRSGTAHMSFEIIGTIFNISDWSKPEISVLPILSAAFVLMLEYFQKEREFLFEISGLKAYYRWTIYILVTFIVMYYAGNDSTFIYMGF
jgi:alginate O-acetyltransferase complex protein AlgI